MSTTSPNMSLQIPTVGGDASPNWALELNQSLSTIDQHNHSAGSGVPINPNGININAALTFQNNFATNLAGLTLTAQGSTPANGTVYMSGNDLYYNNGAGLNIQLTNSSGIVGSPGSISGLTSPASATYSSGTQTFIWQSGASIAANMDFGAAVMRNLSPNSTFALTLSPPAALGSNYSIVLPVLPASQKIMTLDNSGNMSAPYGVDGSSIIISSNTILVGPQGITASMILNNTITTSQIAAQGILAANIANNTITTTQISNSAGITPTQMGSCFTDTSASSGAVTTTSGAFSNITNQQVTISNAVANRPIFFTFKSDGVTTDPNYGTGSFIVLGGTLGNFRVRVNSSSTAYQYSVSASSSDPNNTHAAGELNGVYVPATSGSYTFNLQWSSSGGSTVRMFYVVMSAYQV